MEIPSIINSENHTFWKQQKETHLMNLFHDAANRVPAYKDFLKKNNVVADSIKTLEDLQNVIPISKQNYLSQYGLDEISWDGLITNASVFTTSSGSTGEPFYFHRTVDLGNQATAVHEIFHNNRSNKNTLPTLVIVCFGMGVWIGGLITFQSFYNLHQNGLPFSIITPGINKKEIFSALRKLLPFYTNIVLTGYPPFIKDVIDELPVEGVNLEKKNIRILFAAESFTEEFRDYVVEHAHIKCLYRDTMNIYGSADLGAMAFESPICILIRRLCNKNKKLFQDIFGSIKKTPTLAQYIPKYTTFESDAGNLLVTGNSSLPLIRYSIGDNGGVISFAEMQKHLLNNSINLEEEMRQVGIEDLFCQLPFVYVYERNDFSTNFYGLQVYPEPIRQALINNDIAKYLTGKFTIETTYDNDQNQELCINIELRKNVNVSIENTLLIQNIIVTELQKNNFEYDELCKSIAKRALPKLIFHHAENLTYFRPGQKQQWIKK